MVQFIVLLILILALFLTFAGSYKGFFQAVDTSLETLSVQQSDINNILQYQAQESPQDANVQTDQAELEIAKLTETLANRMAEARGETVLQATTWLDENLYAYQPAEKLEALKQLEALSQNFDKKLFIENTEAFFIILNEKYQEQEALYQEETLFQSEAQTSAIVGLGLFIFAICIQLLLRIEKNTRKNTTDL